MDIKRNGTQASSQASAENFTGKARVDPLFAPPGPARVRGASVTFEPGARTAWHSHPLGQTLIVTAGCSWLARPSKSFSRATWCGLPLANAIGMAPRTRPR